MSKFKVGTFWHDEPGRRKGATAYTRWSREWPGCKEYEIEAESSRDAVRQAIKLRTQEEIGGNK